jgi:hypothetical protein
LDAVPVDDIRAAAPVHERQLRVIERAMAVRVAAAKGK